MVASFFFEKNVTLPTLGCRVTRAISIFTSQPSLTFSNIEKVDLWTFKVHVDVLVGRSRLDATVLTRIILKCAINFELKFFQLHSFLSLLEFLSVLTKLIKL
jgi:hypothetical protein